MRPCCFGYKGRCEIVTPDYCNAVKGTFHKEAALCAQVDCMSDACGLLPFLYKDYPNHFPRFWLSIFVNKGVLTLLLSLIVQLVVLQDLEIHAGWWRIGIFLLEHNSHTMMI